MKFNKNDIDLENLDELIGMCENKMVHPFKKKMKVVIKESQPDQEEIDENESENEELDDEKIAQLLEMYKDLKERG